MTIVKPNNHWFVRGPRREVMNYVNVRFLNCDPKNLANSMKLAIRPESSHAGKLNNLKLSLRVYCSCFYGHKLEGECSSCFYKLSL